MRRKSWPAKLVLLSAAFFAFAYFVGRQLTSQTSLTQGGPAIITVRPTIQTLSYQGQAGQTALELLQKSYRVETKEFDFGKMVMAINGVRADKDRFWAFYVNGKMAKVGAEDYQTADDDWIEWKLEKLH